MQHPHRLVVVLLRRRRRKKRAHVAKLGFKGEKKYKEDAAMSASAALIREKLVAEN